MKTEPNSTPRGQQPHPCCGRHPHAQVAAAAATRKPAKKYFCPMCPGVEGDAPGHCPKCGMSLDLNPAFRTPAAKTVYTCPMHPEIEQDHPGNCPKCGMALEPKSLTAGNEDENAELR